MVIERSEGVSLVRAPHLAFVWEGDELTVMQAVSGERFAVTPDVVRVLDAATGSVTDEALADHCHVARAFVRELERIGLLVDARSAEARGPAYWTTYELALQRWSGQGGARAGWPAYVPAARKTDRGARTQLALPIGVPSATLDETLRRRRSHRHFSDEALSVAELGSILGVSMRVRQYDAATGRSWRHHPSAGARHPLELYVAPWHVQELAPNVYRYDPFEHALYAVAPLDAYPGNLIEEVRAYTGGLMQGEPAALLLVTGVFARTMCRYEKLGLRLVYEDLGALYQTLYLAVTAYELGGCAIAGGSEERYARWLGLDDSEESHIGSFVLGRPISGDGEEQAE